MTRYAVVVTDNARRDLLDIRAWIAADDPAAARRFVQALREQIDHLETLPLRGARIPEADLLGVDIRHRIHGDYRTIYRVEGSRVLVLRVLHGARLLRL
mgnify:CR=1 FL=1